MPASFMFELIDSSRLSVLPGCLQRIHEARTYVCMCIYIYTRTIYVACVHMRLSLSRTYKIRGLAAERATAVATAVATARALDGLRRNAMAWKPERATNAVTQL